MTFVDDLKDVVQRQSYRLGRGPPGKLLGHGIHKSDGSAGIGHDYPVANAGERGLEKLPGLLDFSRKLLALLHHGVDRPTHAYKQENKANATCENYDAESCSH